MKKILNTAILLLLPLVMGAQTLSYEQFIRTVAEKNAGFLAEKYNVDIAVASLQASKVFNDPELSVSYGNNQNWYMYMGTSVETELSYDLDISGSRRARVAAALSEKELSEASVRAYLSDLKLEAAQAWAEAWGLAQSCKILKESVDDMRKIASSDSVRYSLGDVSRADATQSRLEAQTLYGEYVLLQAEYSNALMNLSLLCGGEPVSDISEADLPGKTLPYSSTDLLNVAIDNRADLKAAELSKTLSEDNMRIVRASRAFDLGLSVGYSYNSEVRNEIAPAPKFNGLSVGVTIPLKFSSMNRGEMNAARTQIQQAEKYYESAMMQVKTETAQAQNSLNAAKAVLSQYDTKMLKDARDIMDSRKMGYIKGDSSLVELLSSQQTYRDVMQSYVDACCNYFVAQAALEHAVGYSSEL